MSPKERDIVYIFVHNAGVVEQCRVVANNFSDDGKYLLYGLNSKAHFVADPNDMYESFDACMKATSKKNANEYAIYYDAFDSMEAVLLHSLYAGMTGKKLEELELLALINRASEFMGVDVMSALEKYAKISSKKKSKRNEVDHNAS